MAAITLREAVKQGLWEEMERDKSVFILGEDVGEYGGAFKVTDGFLKHFGAERVIDTPISESAIVGAACGAVSIDESIVKPADYKASDRGCGLGKSPCRHTQQRKDRAKPRCSVLHVKFLRFLLRGHVLHARQSRPGTILL